MLFNTKNQIVTLTHGQAQLCAQGLEDTANGYPYSKAARARVDILSPLRETKQQSNPNGRGTNGMFSMDQRAKFIGYSHLYGNGRRERFVLTN